MIWPSYAHEHYLEVNRYSRPEVLRSATSAAAVHSIGVAGQHPLDTIAYWNSLKDQDPHDKIPDAHRSAHCIIWTDGSLYVAAPPDEELYHVGGTSYRLEAKARFPQ